MFWYCILTSTQGRTLDFLWYICWNSELYIVKKLIWTILFYDTLSITLRSCMIFWKNSIFLTWSRMLSFFSDKKLIMNILFCKHITYIHLSFGQFFGLLGTKWQEKASYSYSSHNLLFFRKKLFTFTVACAFKNCWKYKPLSSKSTANKNKIHFHA